MVTSIDVNYGLFLKRLNQMGINTDLLDEKYGEKIKNGTFTNTNEYGMAYEGSLLEIVLRTLTPYAVKLNELFPEEYRIDRDKLVKVCLLHHIAKSIRLTPNDNAWEVEKRGLVYKYNENNPSIRNGLQSMMIAVECGISFDTDEVEAMTSIDRDLTDMQSRFHSSLFSIIIRQANELTYAEFKTKKNAE